MITYHMAKFAPPNLFIFANMHTRKSYAMVYRSEVLFIKLITSMGIQSIVKSIMNSEWEGHYFIPSTGEY